MGEKIVWNSAWSVAGLAEHEAIKERIRDNLGKQRERVESSPEPPILSRQIVSGEARERYVREFSELMSGKKPKKFDWFALNAEFS